MCKFSVISGLVLLGIISLTKQVFPNILINEIYYYTNDAKEEFVELYNTNEFPVNLSGWQIGDNDGRLFSLPNGVIIYPKQKITIARDENTFVNTFGFLPFITNKYGFRLANTGDEIILLGNTSLPLNGDIVVYGSYNYEDIPFGESWTGTLPPDTPKGTSLQRIPEEYEEGFNAFDENLLNSFEVITPTPEPLNDKLNVYLVNDTVNLNESFNIDFHITASSPFNKLALFFPSSINVNNIEVLTDNNQLPFNLIITITDKWNYVTLEFENDITDELNLSINNLNTIPVQNSIPIPIIASKDNDMQYPHFAPILNLNSSYNIHVMFKQIYYDTTGTDADEEFIELYNPSPYSVDITGWILGDGESEFTMPAQTIIQPGNTIALARNGEIFEQQYGAPPQVSNYGIALSNKGDELYLKSSNNSNFTDFVVIGENQNPDFIQWLGTPLSLIETGYSYKRAFNEDENDELSEILPTSFVQSIPLPSLSNNINNPPISWLETPYYINAHPPAITLNWEENLNAIGYNIYKSNIDGGPFELITNPPLPPTYASFSDLDVQNDTSYFYTIKTVYTNSESQFATQIKVNFHYNIQPPVTSSRIIPKIQYLYDPNIKAPELPPVSSNIDSNKNVLVVRWCQVPNVDYYELFKSYDGETFFLIASIPNAMIFSDPNVEDNESYFYKIRGIKKGKDKLRNGDFSQVIKILCDLEHGVPQSNPFNGRPNVMTRPNTNYQNTEVNEETNMNEIINRNEPQDNKNKEKRCFIKRLFFR